MSIEWLDQDSLNFPPPSQALSDPEGLLAAGGDLSTERLLSAYSQGIFPWYSDPDPILWWSPNPRLILYPDKIHISKSLRKLQKKSVFRVTYDLDFEQVIKLCAATRADKEGTWITPEMEHAYTLLHKQGYAHSVEVWKGAQLVGGLYGVAIDRVFFGESMFSLESNASKMAFVTLAEDLARHGFKLIDCQVETPHLMTLGAELMPRPIFIEQLHQYAKLTIAKPGTFPQKAGKPI
jgi:leucyl/phenylalanyl-tRNA--protein transferase